MENERKSGFGAFVKAVIVLVLLSAIAYVGFKTYQKLPVITFVNNLAQAFNAQDMDKLSNCFTPDSKVKKVIDTANKVADIPILGQIAGGIASLIGSSINYEVDYSDTRITVNGDSSQAVIGVINKNNNDEKEYLTLDMRKINEQWYASALPSVKPASGTDLSYSNSIQGYAERASDNLALWIFSLGNKNQ